MKGFLLALGGLAFVAIFLGLVYLEIWAIQWAWNLVMPSTFGLGAITMWQAAAISVLLGVIGSAFRRTTSK